MRITYFAHALIIYWKRVISFLKTTIGAADYKDQGTDAPGKISGFHNFYRYIYLLNDLFICVWIHSFTVKKLFAKTFRQNSKFGTNFQIPKNFKKLKNVSKVFKILKKVLKNLIELAESLKKMLKFDQICQTLHVLPNITF